MPVVVVVVTPVSVSVQTPYLQIKYSKNGGILDIFLVITATAAPHNRITINICSGLAFAFMSESNQFVNIEMSPSQS